MLLIFNCNAPLVLSLGKLSREKICLSSDNDQGGGVWKGVWLNLKYFEGFFLFFYFAIIVTYVFTQNCLIITYKHISFASFNTLKNNREIPKNMPDYKTKNYQQSKIICLTHGWQKIIQKKFRPVLSSNQSSAVQFQLQFAMCSRLSSHVLF